MSERVLIYEMPVKHLPLDEQTGKERAGKRQRRERTGQGVLYGWREGGRKKGQKRTQRRAEGRRTMTTRGGVGEGERERRRRREKESQLNIQDKESMVKCNKGAYDNTIYCFQAQPPDNQILKCEVVFRKPVLW